MKNLKKFIKQDLAMDLGTANTLIYLQDEGIVLNEPTVIALNYEGQIVKVGQEAKAYLGKTPEGLRAVRPLKDGVIEDFDAASLLIQSFLSRAKERKGLLSPKVVICIPSNITQVEKRAVLEAARAGGAKKIHLLEEIMAAAIGADLPIHENHPMMILDIGGGTTEIAVISQGAYLYSEAIRVAGDEMDEGVLKWFAINRAMGLGVNTAEKVKWDIGAVWDDESLDDLSSEVYGKDLIKGVPKSTTVTARELMSAFEEPAQAIADLVKETLKGLDPLIMESLKADGVTVTGGGAKLRGLATFLENQTGMKFHLAEDPLTTVVRGAGKTIQDFKTYRSVFTN